MLSTVAAVIVGGVRARRRGPGRSSWASQEQTEEQDDGEHHAAEDDHGLVSSLRCPVLSVGAGVHGRGLIAANETVVTSTRQQPVVRPGRTARVEPRPRELYDLSRPLEPSSPDEPVVTLTPPSANTRRRRGSGDVGERQMAAWRCCRVCAGGGKRGRAASGTEGGCCATVAGRTSSAAGTRPV